MFEEIIALIKPLNSEAMEKCQLRIDNLTKPLGSLHSFEHLARQMAGITGNPRPNKLKKSIIVMAADHGVSDEGVSKYCREMTASMVENICNANAAINIFAEHVLANLVLVDIGMASDLPAYPMLRYEKVAYGTKNILHEPAMIRQQTIQAIEVGIKIVQAEVESGSQVLGLGEIGIGSTTAAAALIACYSSKNRAALAGCGYGISDEVFKKKIRVIETALAVNCPDHNDPLDVLAKVGGLDIAGLVGVILGAASSGAAVVLDGLISSAAALVAVKIAPGVKNYLVGSHFSVEPAQKEALEIIGISAHLELDMSLGEGTGAALGMTLINASLHVLNDMKTFGEAEVAVAQDGPGALMQSKNVKD